MRERDQYLKIVQWSEEDQCYVGTCPGFFFGGVHGEDELQVYQELCDVVDEWIESFHDDGEPLPPATAPAKPSETEAWLLAGRPLQPPFGAGPTKIRPTLYRLLGEGGTGSEIAESRVPYDDETDGPREELASLLEETVLPWTRIAGWMEDEGIRSEVERRIRRHLRAAKYSREGTGRLVPRIMNVLAAEHGLDSEGA